jgi:twinkle protein
LAEQGINVLWGSFEIKNSRLIKKLLQQFAREPIEIQGVDNDKKLDAIADRFEQLPMHFMKFHGGTDVDDVLDAMDYAGEPYSRLCLLLSSNGFSSCFYSHSKRLFSHTLQST